MVDKILQVGIERGKYDFYVVFIKDGVAHEIECSNLDAVLAEIKIKLLGL